MIENYENLFRALIGLVALAPAIYVWILQFNEYQQPKDNLTRLKLILVVLNSIFIFTLSPVIVYQVMRAFGGESETFRMLVTIAGGFGPLAMSIAWLYIYKYKIK